jgi:drug/metabolite transporter (DMT)-like permease
LGGLEMNSWLILAAITVMTVIGDYFIKLSSIPDSGVASAYFPLGLVFYGSTGIGWFYMMRSHSLVQIGVYYSAATLVFLAGLGVLVFKEAFGGRDVLGIALALASVVVMGSKG